MQLPDAYKLICHENNRILFKAILFKAKHNRTMFLRAWTQRSKPDIN